MLLLSLATPAHAQAVGSTCNKTNAIIYPTFMGWNGGNSSLICNGSTYVALETGTASPLALGIGTTSPTSLLHTVDSAAKTASYTGVLHSVTDTSSTASVNKTGMDIESTGTWNGTSAVNTGLVVNATGGTTNYAATFSGGNVGIGTTTPLNKLQVMGGGVGIHGSLVNTIPNVPGMYLEYNTGSDQSNIFSINNLVAWKPLDIESSKLILNANTLGNVGIGTTSPNAKLTVSGGGISTGSSSNTDLAGQLTLVAGTKSYTFTGSYTGAPICVASDTAATPVDAQVTTSSTALTLTVPGGANTDTFNYICVARN